MLTYLIQRATTVSNADSFKAIFCFAFCFFAFRRLASLVPNSIQDVDRTRHALVEDLIRATLGEICEEYTGG